jgi:hypothetical protein
VLQRSEKQEESDEHEHGHERIRHSANPCDGLCVAAEHEEQQTSKGGPRAAEHHLLKIAFYLIRDETVYREDGPDYFERRSRDRGVRRHLRHLEQLGYRVTLEPAA